MAAPIKTLVAMEDGLDAGVLQGSLPTDGGVQIVGIVEGLDQSWEVLQETPTDVLVVACDGDSDRALFLVDGSIKAKPERPVVVLYTGNPNGFVRRVFEAGADDIVGLPQTPDNVRFAIEKASARRQGGTGAVLRPPPRVNRRLAVLPSRSCTQILISGSLPDS